MMAQSSSASPGGKTAALGPLRPALEIDVGAFLLGIGGARQDHIGMMGAGIAMAALIDDEGAAQMRDIGFVGAQEIDRMDLALIRAVHDARHIAAALAGQEPRSSAATREAAV